MKRRYLFVAIIAGIVVASSALVSTFAYYYYVPRRNSDTYIFPSGTSQSCGAAIASGSYIEAKGFKEISQLYKSRLAAGSQGMFQFVLTPGSTGEITQLIDYNPSFLAGGPPKTTQQVMNGLFHQTISEHFNQVDIYKIDTTVKDPSQQESIVYLPHNQTNGISIVASDISNVTDSKVQVKYTVRTEPSTEKGVYLLGLTYTCPGAILTIGDELYFGPLPWDNGTRY